MITLADVMACTQDGATSYSVETGAAEVVASQPVNVTWLIVFLVLSIGWIQFCRAMRVISDLSREDAPGATPVRNPVIDAELGTSRRTKK